MARISVDERAIRSVRRAFKDLNPELNKRLTSSLKEAAAPVVVEAKRRMNADINAPKKRRRRSSGRAAGSFRVLAKGNRVTVAAGKKAVPYYGWLDYGGDLKPAGGRKNTIKRPFKKHGRYLYPAAQAMRPVVRRNVRQALERALDSVGL